VIQSAAGNLVRKLFDVGDRLTCKACGRRIEARSEESMLTGEIIMTARCHGAVERFAFTLSSLRGPDYAKPLTPFVAWVDNLFAADCNPDVMELLRYNRGEVPS
jgi:hypothetical protein